MLVFIMKMTSRHETSVARAWTPRVSPRHNHKFHGEFFTEENTGHPWWLPRTGLPLRGRAAPTRRRRQTDVRTNRQTDVQHHRVKPPL